MYDNGYIVKCRSILTNDICLSEASHKADREKNEHLEKFLEPVEPYEFYREIFPEGSFERKGHFEDRKGNGIAVTVPKGEVDKATGIALQIEGDGKAKRCTITDELDELRAVSYTHLDVYKRQSCGSCKTPISRLCPLSPILDGGGAAKMPGISMPLSLIHILERPEAEFFVFNGRKYLIIREEFEKFLLQTSCI